MPASNLSGGAVVSNNASYGYILLSPVGNSTLVWQWSLPGLLADGSYFGGIHA